MVTGRLVVRIPSIIHLYSKYFYFSMHFLYINLYTYRYDSIDRDEGHVETKSEAEKRGGL